MDEPNILPTTTLEPLAQVRDQNDLRVGDIVTMRCKVVQVNLDPTAAKNPNVLLEPIDGPDEEMRRIHGIASQLRLVEPVKQIKLGDPRSSSSLTDLSPVAGA